MEQLVIVVGRDVLNDLRQARDGSGRNNLPKNALYVKDARHALSWLSPERIHLLQKLVKYDSFKSISEIAKETNRKQEAISRDASILALHGAIEKKKKGKQVFLKPKIDSIRVEFK